MLDVLEWSAVIAFALYGALRAARLNFDAVGFVTLAMLVAFGGGTLRDVCLGRYPVFWVEHERFAAAVFVLALVASWLPRPPARLERWLLVPDALGLGLYAVTGAGYALAAGAGPLVAALMGVMTGCVGGVIADVVGNQTPSIFRRHSTLYATCAFAGALAYVGCDALGWPVAGAVAGFGITVLLRGLSLRYRWALPGPREGRPRG